MMLCLETVRERLELKIKKEKKITFCSAISIYKELSNLMVGVRVKLM